VSLLTRSRPPVEPSEQTRELAAPAPLREAPRIYTGRTINELVPRIVAELGSDAVVLRHERGFTGGFAGFFRRPFVEIEVTRGAPRLDCYDEEDGAAVLPQDGEAVAAAVQDFQETTSFPPVGFAAELASAEAASPVVVEDVHAHGTYPPGAPPTEGTPPQAAPPEVAPPETVAPQTDPPTAQGQLPETDPPAAQYQLPALVWTGPNQSATPAAPRVIAVSSGPAREAIERTLLGAGVDEQLVREALEAATAHVLPLLDASSPPPLAGAVRRALAQRIPVCRPLPTGGAAIAFVGPGGAGKSACCAALLDAYHRRSTLPAVRATLVPGAPADGLLDVLFAPHVPGPLPAEDPLAAQALARARAEGLLLLDTPSLSPADERGIAALAATLARLAPDRVVLALPATLGARSAARLLEAYRPLGTAVLAVTHVDETDQLGVAVQVGCALGLAPAYLLEGGTGGFALTQVEPADLARRLLPPR
jgi:flagellar biosynthesis GTPase FlhF